MFSLKSYSLLSKNTVTNPLYSLIYLKEDLGYKAPIDRLFLSSQKFLGKLFTSENTEVTLTSVLQTHVSFRTSQIFLSPPQLLATDGY